MSAPDRDTVEYFYWLGTQRGYHPCYHEEADWERAAELLAEEREALARVDEKASDPEAFDEAAFEEYESEGSLYGLLELGVTGLVYALNAASCVTALSCRDTPAKGPASHGSCALPVGSAPPPCSGSPSGPALRSATWDGGGIAILAPSVVETMAMAEGIVAKASAFDAITPTA